MIALTKNTTQKIFFFIFLTLSFEQNLFSEPKKNNKPKLILIDAYFNNAKQDFQNQYNKILNSEIEKVNEYQIVGRRDSIDKLIKIMISPAKKSQEEKLKEIEKLMKEGDSLLYTDPKSAVSVLNRAKQELKDIMESMTLNKTVRDYYFSSQMLLARSYLDNNNMEKTEEILSETIRIYGDEVKVTEENYHPALVKIYNKVLKQMEKMKKAGLKIKSTPTDCTVIINGREMKTSTPAELNDLYPGQHNLQLRCGNMESMIYRVDLQIGKTTEKEINVYYDSIFLLDKEHFGFYFSSSEDFYKSGVAFVGKLKDYIDADFALLAGFTGPQESAELTGMLIDLKSNSVIVKNNVDASSDKVLISTAKHFLNHFFVTKKSVRSVWYKNWIGWSLIGAGVVGWGVGAYFISDFYTHKNHAEDINWKTEEDRLDEKDKGDNAKIWAWILCGVGTAAIAGGITTFILQSSGEETSALSEEQIKTEYLVRPIIFPDGGGAEAVIKF